MTQNTISFKNLLDEYGFKITIHKPTRISKTCSNCVDNILMNFSTNTYEADVLDPCMSDHRAQVMQIKLCYDDITADKKIVNERKYIARKFTRDGVNIFLNELILIDLSFSPIKNDADYVFTTFLDKFTDSVNRNFPFVEKKIKNFKINWFNDELRHLRDKISFLKDIYNNNPNDYLKSIIKVQEKLYSKKIYQAKLEANKNFILNSSNKQKSIWQVIHSETNQSQHKLSSSELSADEFCKYFANIAEEILKTIPETNQSASTILANSFPSNKSSIFLHPTDEHEIFNAIHSLSNSSSKDIYGLNSHFLKISASVISLPLSQLVNKCFEEGIFPTSLKITKIVPIHKKDDINELTNYRPIAIVPVISKIFEIILKDRLMSFFGKHSLFTCKQFGFRPKLGTIKAATEIITSILEGFDKRTPTYLTLCDLSKAFDCVNHAILLAKLYHYGIRGAAYKIIKSFLSNRKQYVEFNGVSSSLIDVNHGVPQGSILGPLLFIIFINDLPAYIQNANTEVNMYADDVSVAVKSNNSDHLINISEAALISTQNWFNFNLLKMNAGKTQKLIFDLSTNNLENIQNQSVIYLGLKLDKKLTWKHHIEDLSKKLSKKIFFLRKLCRSVTTEVKRIAYFSIFQANLSYGVLLWGHAKSVQTIFKIQKKAIRIINNKKKREHCRQLFIDNGIMTVYSLFIYHCLLYIKENIHKYPKVTSVHDYNIRSKHKLRLPRHRLEKCKDGLYMSTIFYNKLPFYLKDMDILNFKRKIKAILIKACLYNMSDFFSIQFENYK